MRILIEEHQYQAEAVKDILKGIDALENVDGLVSLNYVGYFYNTRLEDCVFILPKVLLEDIGGRELVFGKYEPEAIINIDSNNPLTEKEKDFIYEFSVWIYRAICVFRDDKHNDNDNDTSIVFHKQVIEAGKGRRKLSNTFLDILLALIQWNKDNKNFVFFVLRNLHSGFNKITWTRTIARNNAIVQDDTPTYLNVVNKKRQVNFDEELLVIFYSILNYISDHYGFAKNINANFTLIKGKQFETYLKGYGKTRLHQIKYKYFSDKALELWELCYAFFDSARQVRMNSQQKEYLLVKNFNIVFEAIIDELIGDKKIPAGLKEQDDGKMVDHMYIYHSLTTHEKDKPVYYIGDSKYYKRGNPIGKESVYKQFTYARNVIQWNLNLFMNSEEDDAALKADRDDFMRVPMLRDKKTEGYNIIPNFFISARLNRELSYEENISISDKQRTHFGNRHFKNRLFDRDTLLVCHYDVNFLYVVSLYARNNRLQKKAWKEKVREMFRREIQGILKDHFEFYAMQARPGVDGEAYIKDHFQDLLRYVYSPFDNKEIMSMALDKDEEFSEENKALLAELRNYFIVEEVGLGENPSAVIESARRKAFAPIPDNYSKEGVLMVMMENYEGKFQSFSDGRIAIGIKMTDDSMKILENIKSIGFILFHTRKDVGQHLFAVKSCEIHPQSLLDDSVYRNISTADLYLQVSFDSASELDSSAVSSSLAPYVKQTRYDAQYETISSIIRSDKLKVAN